MARGRKELADPPLTWSISIPSSIATKVNILLFDPLYGKVQYGKRAELITHLLAQWLETQVKKGDERND